ncbi:hypothetical protein FO497_08155 [Bacillus cereus ATCC 10876]|uniref:hypothetical protein n=1 Tax=Bacillus TaxID=1386 RepID=UPI00019FF52F|nr:MULTISPECIES: hypothetical protein [Bacillus]MDJ0279993.1 hypothetical protein [Bacillus bombysepticus]EEK49167.1 hypothetical protein bcere0002_37640 [Bacillus cereus ATCC 10876]KFL77696.1 hypothetical protein DJ50_3942 [Bacillus cereus ATCC 10876]MBG9868350.1 hypothetical protein [Bacillus cereus]MBO1128978.1 hypothetical protein [Bacillus cereus]
MFIKEFKVNGSMIEGQVIGNWSNKSYYALKIEKMKMANLDVNELDTLIAELENISVKIKESNAEYERDYKSKRAASKS